MKTFLTCLALLIIGVILGIKGCENWENKARVAYLRDVAVAAGISVPDDPDKAPDIKTESKDPKEKDKVKPLITPEPSPTRLDRQLDGTVNVEPVTPPAPPAKPTTATPPPVASEVPELTPGDLFPPGNIDPTTPPLPSETPSSSIPTVPEYREYTGLKFQGKGLQSPFKLTPPNGTMYLWYTSEGEEQMKFLNVKGIADLKFKTEGPVIYEVVTIKGTEDPVLERFKKQNGNATHYSRWDGKAWLTPVPLDILEHTKGALVQIRALKDPDNPLIGIQIEFGIPIK